MSIRYKLFGAFCLVISLACGLAFYGIRGISSSGDMVVRLYDGPLMGINYARSALASMNEARLLVHRSQNEGAPKEFLSNPKRLTAARAAARRSARERVDSKDVTAALDRAGKF